MKKREDEILVGVLEPGGAIEFFNVDNTLEAFQDLVGGYIETVRIMADYITICNEDGRRLGLAENIGGLVGPLVFCKTRGEEFWSLSQRDVVLLRAALEPITKGGRHNGQKNT